MFKLVWDYHIFLAVFVTIFWIVECAQLFNEMHQRKYSGTKLWWMSFVRAGYFFILLSLAAYFFTLTLSYAAMNIVPVVQ